MFLSAHKCGYCDFASLAGVDHLADRYLDALEGEIEITLPEPQEVDTIFVGGGTPTRLESVSVVAVVSNDSEVADLDSGRGVDNRGESRHPRP